MVKIFVVEVNNFLITKEAWVHGAVLARFCRRRLKTRTKTFWLPLLSYTKTFWLSININYFSFSQIIAGLFLYFLDTGGEVVRRVVDLL